MSAWDIVSIVSRVIFTLGLIAFVWAEFFPKGWPGRVIKLFITFDLIQYIFLASDAYNNG